MAQARGDDGRGRRQHLFASMTADGGGSGGGGNGGGGGGVGKGCVMNRSENVCGSHIFCWWPKRSYGNKRNIICELSVCNYAICV